MTQRKSFEADLGATDDEAIARPMAPTLGELWSRRAILKGLGGAGLIATTSTSLFALAACDGPEKVPGFTFKELPRGVDEHHHVAEGYDADILIRWGDPVLAAAPAFDPQHQTAEAQRKQFGYNNDYVGFVPLPYGSGASDRGLLCVNHEYTNATLMFPGLADVKAASSEQVDVAIAAHGCSIVEIALGANGKWAPVAGGAYNRRITPLDTEIRISGPAAGHARLKTSVDPEGTRVLGTLNNCAGGITPWGSYLTGEENVNIYFAGKLDAHPEASNYGRMGIPGDKMGWARFHKRFDINEEPNEANRFGWVVEIDPLDPAAAPRKRTALGRFKHEGCENVLTKDGRLAIYMGDDQRFEYLYKFVTAGKVDPQDRAANRDLLDEGTLYVARFEEDGSGTWRPLTHDANGLNAANGFSSQADVLIEARRAADILGATPLDRPEDVQPNPLTGKVYVSLTNNSKRTADKVDAVNPRADNLWGQIVEITPKNDDHGADSFTWTLLVTCGDPTKPEEKAKWTAATTADGWFACPDNLAVDGKGRLWVATDQGDEWSQTSGAADGVFALETDGAGRGTSRRFFRVPVGAEMCGPCFTPDTKTLFVAVQHPGADGTKDFKGFKRASTFDDPATRWPDFTPGMPPRPSVVAIRDKKGGPIGG